MTKSENKRSVGKAADKLVLQNITINDMPISPSTDEIKEIFVDGFKGVLHRDGVVKIHFFSDILNVPTETIERKVTLRLVTSTTNLVHIQEALNRIVARYREAGLIREKVTKSERKKSE